MKFEISKNKLFSILKLCIKTIDDQTTNQILGGILINADLTNGITFISSNTNVSCKNTIKSGVTIFENGTVLVKCSLLFNLINKVKADQVLFQKIDDSVLRIKADNYTCDLNLFEEHTYPTIVFDTTSWKKTQINSSFLKEISQKLLSCTAPFLNSTSVLAGILIDSTREKGIIEAVSTDSYHLVYIKQISENEPFKTIIGVENLRTIVDAIEKDDKVDVFLKENKIIFSIGDILFSCRSIEGEYPSTIKAIQTKLEYEIVVDRHKLNNAIERACVFNQTEKKQPSSMFKIEGKMLSIHSKNIEFGASHEELEVISYNGPQIEVCLNTKYLNDLLKNISSENVLIELQAANKQIMIKDEKNENYSSLILPIRFV